MSKKELAFQFISENRNVSKRVLRAMLSKQLRICPSYALKLVNYYFKEVMKNE
jgi:hypothetical protein